MSRLAEMIRDGDQENAPSNRTGRGWLMGARDTERGERNLTRRRLYHKLAVPCQSKKPPFSVIVGVRKEWELAIAMKRRNGRLQTEGWDSCLPCTSTPRSAEACPDPFLEQWEKPTDSCTSCCKNNRLRHRCRGAWTIHLGEQSLMSFCNACRWVSLRLDLLQLLRCYPPTNVAPRLVCGNKVKEDLKTQLGH